MQQQQQQTSGYQALRALLRSDEFKAVYFDPVRRAWIARQGNLPLKGVRRLLEQRGWPSYDYEAAERIAGRTPDERRVRTGMTGGGFQGSRRGRVVHEQLQLIAAHGFAVAHRILAGRRQEMSPLVTLLLQNFKEIGIKLVVAELPVYSINNAAKLGSSIDLVCARKSDGALIFLELKVGGDNYYNKANGNMENELSVARIANSPINQAVVQLMAYKLLFEAQYSRIVQPQHIASWSVVFVGPSGVLYRKITQRDENAVRVPVQRLLLAAAAADGANRQNNRRNNAQRSRQRAKN